MTDDSTTNLVELFEKKMACLSKNIEEMTSLHNCQMLMNLRTQHFITLEKCRSVELRKKRMIKNYQFYSSNMGRHLVLVMEEFKVFLISIKSALDSLAKEINIIFSIEDPKVTFNLATFIEKLQKENAHFAKYISQFCNEENWFTYFLSLRNPPTHTGRFTPSSYIELKGLRETHLELTAEFEITEGEIREISETDLVEKPLPVKNEDVEITDLGFYLPDNPEEFDSSKSTYDHKIKFKDYYVDLSRKVAFLFEMCYREVDKELNQTKVTISNKKCHKVRCCEENCNLRLKTNHHSAS